MSYILDKIIIPIIIAVVVKLIMSILSGEGQREKGIRQKIISWLKFFGPDAFTLRTFIGAIIGAFVFWGCVYFIGLPGPAYSPNIVGSSAPVWYWLGLLLGSGIGAQITMRYIEKRKLSFSDTIDYAILATMLTIISTNIVAV